MRFLPSIIALLAVLKLGCCEKARFDNYQVYRIVPHTENDLLQLVQIWKSKEYSFWNEPSFVEMPVNIMVLPHQRVEFEELLGEFEFDSELVIENLQRLVDEEEMSQKSAPKKMEWTKYHSLSDIYTWLDELAAKYEEVKVVVAGKSYEKRDIKGIEINFGKNLPGVFLEAGIHAREWIGPAGTSWIINEILNSTKNSTFRQFNYMYFPIYNPDGYAYSWEKDRMWRKTRTPYKSGSRTCYGADPNRNWDCHWNEGGSSNNPCDETYAGPSAFSEVETAVMANYTKAVAKAKNHKIYISYHSYSQLLLYPWGYTDKPAKHKDIWDKIAKAAAEDLRLVHGTKFKVGQIYTTIYQVSGSAIEWYYDNLNATISFVYEMRDTGRYGFMLPADQIIPSGEEHLASLRRILLEYQKLKHLF